MSGGQICGKLKAKGVKHMSKLRYVWCGDYLIPDLTLNVKVYPPLGKYGRMREMYLREQHARPPCPSPTPRVHSDSHPSSQ